MTIIMAVFMLPDEESLKGVFEIGDVRIQTIQGDDIILILKDGILICL